LQFGT